MCGDIVGSSYEVSNIKHVPTMEEMLSRPHDATDDSVLTCAVASALMEALPIADANKLFPEDTDALIREYVTASLVEFGHRYPLAGYGGAFHMWLKSENKEPYNSWGNGSAMRASYCGWIARSFDEAMRFAKASAEVTHNHPEGIKGAQAVAGCIYKLREGASKEDILRYASELYDMDFTLDEIRATYTLHVNCAQSVPQALKAFLEGNSFEEVIALAISIGGDSDTIAAIAGSLAEVIYPMPEEFVVLVNDNIDDFIGQTYCRMAQYIDER